MEIIKRLEDFYRDKKVLITGHTGFIGSWTAICLNELGAEVIGYALPPYTDKDNFVVSELERKIDHNEGDIRNFENLKNVIEKSKPEIILHLAAQSIVRKSYSFPKETYDINVGGTINLFESFRVNKFSKVLINFTSDKCYENIQTSSGFREKDRLGGRDPYSSSKACSELITSAYYMSFFSGRSAEKAKFLASIRSGNVIGGGDWQEDRLIPDCMRALIRNKPVILRNPDHIRPWQHVLEPIFGMLILCMKIRHEPTEKYLGAWNFGPVYKSNYSVIELIKLILSYLGKGEYFLEKKNNEEKKPESSLLTLDCSKAKKDLGWEQILTIHDTIKLVCDWYMEKNVDYDFNVKQIEYYTKKLDKFYK